MGLEEKRFCWYNINNSLPKVIAVSSRDFLEEQRRRQRELVEARKARQNPGAEAPVAQRQPSVLTLGQKLQNFWYYYKWFVAAGVFLATVLGIGVHQCASKESYDTQIVLLSYDAYTGGQLDAIELELEKYGVDLNGDSKINIQIIDCAYSKSEAADLQNAKRQKLTGILAANNDALLFLTSEEAFWFLDGSFDGGIFADLSMPDDDGKSIVLPDSFYTAVDAESENGFTLPRGLRLSRRRADKSTMIGQANGIEKKITAADQMLQNILNTTKAEP